MKIGVLRDEMDNCNFLGGEEERAALDQDSDDPHFWLTGRVVLYDPYTHKHKIEWRIPEFEGDSVAAATAAASPDASPPTPKRGRPPKKKPANPGSGATGYDETKNTSTWIWLRNEEHNLHLATRMVW